MEGENSSNFARMLSHTSGRALVYQPLAPLPPVTPLSSLSPPTSTGSSISQINSCISCRRYITEEIVEWKCMACGVSLCGKCNQRDRDLNHQQKNDDTHIFYKVPNRVPKS